LISFLSLLSFTQITTATSIFSRGQPLLLLFNPALVRSYRRSALTVTIYLLLGFLSCLWLLPDSWYSFDF